MSLSRIFRRAASAWLAVLFLVVGARAQDPTYNVASDWATTYPTTTALNAATSATWGAGNVWSAGTLSNNWTNQAQDSFSPNYSNNVQFLSTYYNTNTTGYETSGGTNVATFTYTVPFQAYQYNPGSTANVAISPSLAAQISSGFNSIGGAKMTVPSLMHVTNPSGTSSAGDMQEFPKVTAYGATTEEGFGLGNASNFFNDSTGTTQAELPGVFYGYASTNSTGTGIAIQEAPSGSLDNVLVLGTGWGPSYVAWTAPGAGTITSISVNAWNLQEQSTDNDGNGGFAVFTAPNQSSLGTNLFSALEIGHSGNTGIQGQVTSTVGTTNSNIGQLAGYATATKGWSDGVSWSANNITVTAGQVLWFIADGGHTYNNGGYHSEEGGQDPIALQTIITFVPEPSSAVLLGFAGLGFGLAVWKRRRLAG